MHGTWHRTLLLAAGTLALATSGVAHAANNGKGVHVKTAKAAAGKVVGNVAFKCDITGGPGLSAGPSLSAGPGLPGAPGLPGKLSTSGAPGFSGKIHISGTTAISGQTTIKVGPGGDLPPFAGGVPFLNVTSVNGNTILGTAMQTVPVTVTVDSSTTYNQAGQSASLADIHAGSQLSVCGSSTDTGGVKASSISIILPSLNGVITAVNGSSFTITTFDGATRIVGTDASTKVDRAGTAAAVSDLVVGSAIDAVGKVQSDHSLQALHINIVLPQIAGKVTAVSSNTITIDNGQANDHAPSIVTSSNTVYNSKGTSTATASSIKVGSFIVAEGSESVDGQTLNALRITTLPDGAVGPGGTKMFGFTKGDFSGSVSISSSSDGVQQEISTQGPTTNSSSS
ncbi:MAG: hypothetical protein JWO42_687 [Chloroflexi bacterium]|nr:hypothetical protein [Chloroflexota bacterium]